MPIVLSTKQLGSFDLPFSQHMFPIFFLHAFDPQS